MSTMLMRVVDGGGKGLGGGGAGMVVDHMRL